MKLFDILGPVMVGPSSSHTAGAVRIGLVARKLFGGQPEQADILLYGSFAATGAGHGTDRALAAGLLGMQPDDMRIPDSLELAKQQGIKISFGTVAITGDAHPNTALLRLQKGTHALEVMAASLGGGRIQVCQIDGIDARFSGEYDTLIVHNNDEPGHIAAVTGLLSKAGVNIAAMRLARNEKGGYAVMVVECDQPVSRALGQQVQTLPGVLKVTRFNLEEDE